ncbi:hypothetical protein V8F20_009354 [Naviculisporaceae sp. PSN 640]
MAALAPTSASSHSLLSSIVSITVTVTASASPSPVISSAGHQGPFSTGTPEKSESCDEFTRANLVGVFITVILCLITQPSGSLYFRGHGGFFWRINPIASFVEAGIIFWYLAVAVWESVVKRRSELQRFRTCREKMTFVLAHVQQMAGALLLIRGQVDGTETENQREDDGETPLLESLLGEGNDEGGDALQEIAASVGAEDGAQGGNEGRRNDSENGIKLQESTMTSANSSLQEPPLGPSENDEGRIGPRSAIVTAPAQQPTAEPPNTHPIALPPSSCSAPSSSLIQRRSTTELEANPVTTSDSDSMPDDTDNSGSHQDPDDEVSAALRRLLRQAFGSDALRAHRESRIASVTFFSVFVIYVKIFSVSGASWFKAAVWFSLSGWVAVQTLLILHARRPKMSEQDLSDVIRLIQMVDKELDFNAKKPERESGRSWWWSAMFFVLHLPFWVFVAYRVTFGWKQTPFFTDKDHYEGEETFASWAGNVYMLFKSAVGFWAAVCLILWFIGQLLVLVLGLFRADRTEIVLSSLRHLFLCTVGTPLFAIVWMFGALDMTTDDLKGWLGLPNNAGNSSGGVDVALKIAWYVGYGSWNTAWTAIDICALGLLFFLFVGLRDRLRVALFNILFTLGIFLWYLYTYESEGTTKWWLGEYLG